MTRVGRKNNPAFQIIVIDSRKQRDGKYIEKLGHYNPSEKHESNFKIDMDRYKYWISNGAQPTLAENILLLITLNIKRKKLRKENN